MNEFEAITKYFLPLTQGRGEARGLGDDAAVLKIPAGHELVVTSDTLNEGAHFPAAAAPADIARKALRANLSDLAAMGADPYAYQLSIAFPQKPEEKWLAGFTRALLEDQKEFGIFCSGGDTTRIEGPLSVSITALGLVPAGQAVPRGGAKPGDLILLTGPIGDAFIGLEILRGNIQSPEGDYFISRYFSPMPRISLSQTLRAHAHAAIDVSDGLLADLGHVASASGLEAVLDLERILFSPAAKKLLSENEVSHGQLLAGGDDYELAIAVPEDRTGHFPESAIIGRFQSGAPGVRVLDGRGKDLDFRRSGWAHF